MKSGRFAKKLIILSPNMFNCDLGASTCSGQTEGCRCRLHGQTSALHKPGD